MGFPARLLVRTALCLSIASAVVCSAAVLFVFVVLHRTAA